MAARGGPGGNWLSYPEAQERVIAGLPVEVLDPYAPEWRVEQFTSHVPLRHYRIPGTEGPVTRVASQVREGDVVRVFTSAGVLIDVIEVPEGSWKLVFQRSD